MLSVELPKFIFIHRITTVLPKRVMVLPSGEYLANFRYRPVLRTDSQPSIRDCFICLGLTTSDQRTVVAAHMAETLARTRRR